MISVEESGLSQSDYEALLATYTRPNFSITAHRWNPDFGSAAWVTGPESNTGDDWDAVADDQYIYRVWGGGTTNFGFHRIDLTTGVISAVYSNIYRPGDATLNTRYRVALGDTPGVVYLYANVPTGMLRRQLSDYGITPSSWTYIASGITSVNRLSENQFYNGTATASSFDSYEYSDYSADSAFDNNRETFWATPTGTTTGWLRYQLPAAVALTRYDMFCNSLGSPKSWTFEGSNDGSAWTTLDTRVTVPDWNEEWRTYTFSNSTAYLYYRINVTARQVGVNQVQIHELRGFYVDMGIAAIDDFAVSTWDRIHYTFLDEATNTYQLRFLVYEGSAYVVKQSDIYLTFRPQAIEAVSRIKDANSVYPNRRTDIVVLNTEVPGVEKIVAEDNTPVRYMTTAKGLLSFWVRSSEASTASYTWSEYYEIDMILETNTSNFRDYARLSLIDNQAYLTTYSSDGVSNYTNLGCRYYTSKEGRYWSLGNMLPIDAGLYGIKLIRQGDYLYAVERSAIWRSYSTLQFGYSPTAIQLDLTPYVMDYSTDNSSMFAASFTLANDTGLFANHTWFNRQNVIALEHRSGYYIGTGYLDYPVGITEVDVLEYIEQFPEQLVRVSSRDHLGWMTDKFKGENAKYWNSFRAAGDNYLDKTGTNYGGLSHTAIQEGRWETEDGELVCKIEFENATPSGSGVVFASDPTNLWNGVVEVAFQMQDGADARAGIVFRAQDFYHRWMVYYHPTADEIRLEYWHGYKGNVDKEEDLATDTAIGWTNVDTQWHYLRVRFYYGRISVWHSDDGIDWVFSFHYLMDATTRQYGVPYLKKAAHVLSEKAYVGLWAQTHDTFETRFSNLKIYEIGNLHVVENAFRAYASLAGIHEHQFDTLPYSTDVGDWTYNATTFAYGDQPSLSDYPGFTLYSESGWLYALSENPLPAHNVVIKTRVFFNASEAFGIIVRALDDGTFLVAGRDYDGYPVILSYNGSTYTVVYQGDYTLFGSFEVTVSFQEVSTGSDSDTFWHLVSMWWNDKLVANYIEDYGSEPISGEVNWGFAGNTSLVFFENPRLPELNVISDWTTLDPGEAPMSALSRAIEGLNLRFFVRYDGRLYAWRPKARASVYEYANRNLISGLQDSFDQRKLRTAIRVVGGYAEAVYHDKDLIRQYEYRFQEVNNPFILTHDEAYREARLVLMRMLEQATQTQFTHPHTAFLEPEDRVTTPLGERTITGIGIQYTGPIHNQQLALRGYPYGEPEE